LLLLGYTALWRAAGLLVTGYHCFTGAALHMNFQPCSFSSSKQRQEWALSGKETQPNKKKAPGGALSAIAVIRCLEAATLSYHPQAAAACWAP